MTEFFEDRFVYNSIERSIQDLPALPSVVSKVLLEAESPDACAQRLEHMISTDQALASKVLRVVNSAYYGLSGQVTGLGQAVVILGLQQIRNLVLSVSAISTMKPKTPRQHDMLKLFWMHAFGTAAATQLIAKKKQFHANDVETMFIGGLLHDIGRLYLFSNFTQTYDQVVRYAEEMQMAIEPAEQAILGLSHAMVGERMASHWNLPPVLVKMIADHEGPFEADADPMLFALNIGDWITEHLYYETDAIPMADPDPRAFQWLAFSEEEVEWLRTEVQRKVNEASQMFGLIAA